ncbi:MAG TPA: cupin domain-containing protein [Campylobacterales bacterium]|nr:cupin domain-containing protein [Campylobacterales bacterium]
METTNLYQNNLPPQGEVFTPLLEHKNVKIVRIISSNDFESMAYIQEEDEWVVLVEGEATLLVDNEKKILKKGESLFIPAKTPHQIIKMKHGTIWLAIHIY